ncbi:lipid-A-disaccharide synthase [Siphonobacter sp. SORGH_AS_0500]|uniref:lipid-A-disaccharide synthase n=1 Tax=Siphonobacter sp. SORGH_AS_0500 TaxID=1864824 RepID=UPI000CC2C74F|nr:lipid-A-disaccharide synthase [Siphonobacter sp. SORGH_AS_0500]PKK34922.1 lipid-A-disaccharide synthase [Siphonobacter sp. SORGH_AS_0500]
MKYFLIAGERSGDLHGSNLIKGILQHDASAEIQCWGGELMEEAGAHLLHHYRDSAFMGFWEVAKNYGTIRRQMKECKQHILAFRPDVLILIDYAGFNLRMATFAKQHQIRTFYYISPKVWAWNQKRALKIKRVVDRMFCIFPFEVDFFRKFDYEVDYVGNPLLDAIASFQPNPAFKAKHGLGERPIVAILPGSRVQEVKRMLPKMLSVRNQFPQYQFVIGKVSNLSDALYATDVADLSFVTDASYDLLSVAHSALVTSGTATLETALFNVPEVVCYEAGSLTYLIAKQLVKVPFISLVNLIADKEVVKELIQEEFNTERIAKELKLTLEGASRQTMLKEYKRLQELIGQPGASERTGGLMVKALKK